MRLKSFFITLITFVCCLTAVLGQEQADPKQLELKQDTINNATKLASTKKSTRIEDSRGEPLRPDKMDSKQEIFYSNAKMYVAQSTVPVDPSLPNGEKESSMFIQGTAKFDNGAEIDQRGETSLTGDFVTLKQYVPGETVNPLFASRNADGSIDEDSNYDNIQGVIKFTGRWNNQNIVRENADGTLASSKDKLNYYMHFPVLKIAKDGYIDHNVEVFPGDPSIKYDWNTMGKVSAASNIAMSTSMLNTNDGNRFSVEVITDGLDQKRRLGNGASPAAAEYYKLNPAYVHIESLSPGNVNDGYHEVEMKLYDYDESILAENILNDQKIKETNTVEVKKVNIGGEDYAPFGERATFLRGFTSPFVSHMRADYMFYHVLTKPNDFSVTSGLGPIGDPETKILSGIGYFSAMDVSTSHFEEIQKNWHSGTSNSWELRERGGYNLSRYLREMNYRNNPNFSLYTFVKDSNNPKWEEQLFNVAKDAFVNVKVWSQGYDGAVAPNGKAQGLNYLANPFMTPISLNKLLGKLDADGNVIIPTTEAEKKEPYYFINYSNLSLVGYSTKAVHHLTKEAVDDANTNYQVLLRSKFWIVNSGLVAHVNRNGVPVYAYNIKYDNVSLVSDPSTQPDVTNRYIEPMQMFMVQAANTGYISLSLDQLKTKTGSPFATSLKTEFEQTRKSRALEEKEDDTQKYNIPDWFVVEATVDEGGAITADRTAIRFFDTATEGLDYEHDVQKMLVAAPAPKQMRSQNLKLDEESLAPMNVIYTTTPDRDALLGNGINYKVDEVPLHYLPGKDIQSVTLSFHGLDGFKKVEGVWLIDTFTGYKEKLEEGSEYQFQSTPGESSISSKNRFILQFHDNDNQGPTLTENPITCYYSGSTLHIGGLNEKDLGSKVQIFDLQGRLMGNTTITNHPSMEYHKTLGQGTFIVRITGKRNYNTKFVNLQNY